LYAGAKGARLHGELRSVAEGEVVAERGIASLPLNASPVKRRRVRVVWPLPIRNPGAPTNVAFVMSIFSRDRKRDELRRVPLFAALPRRQFDLLVRTADIVELPAGREVIREGETGCEFFAIAEGEVEVSKGGESIATERSGDVFGEIALLRGIPRTATVRTTVPTRAFVLTAQAFRSILAPSFVGTPLPPDVK
jgi:hypothetical protein